MEVEALLDIYCVPRMGKILFMKNNLIAVILCASQPENTKPQLNFHFTLNLQSHYRVLVNKPTPLFHSHSSSARIS